MGVSQLFLVRVWRAASSPAGFSASVRRVDSEQLHVFTCGADVVRYLETQVADATADVAPPDSERRNL
jgi:hypothetical protein